MIEFLTHYGLASNWAVWEDCLEIRKLGARQYGASLGQMERTASPGDANDGDLATHVIERNDDGAIISYARLYPRPNRGHFDAARPSMRLELERVCIIEDEVCGEELSSERLVKLIAAIIGHARSNNYDAIGGYGEREGLAVLDALNLDVNCSSDSIKDGKRLLYRFEFSADDKNQNSLRQMNVETTVQRTTEKAPSVHRRTQQRDANYDVLEELEAMFGVDMSACRKNFEGESSSLELA